MNEIPESPMGSTSENRTITSISWKKPPSFLLNKLLAGVKETGGLFFILTITYSWVGNPCSNEDPVSFQFPTRTRLSRERFISHSQYTDEVESDVELL